MPLIFFAYDTPDRMTSNAGAYIAPITYALNDATADAITTCHEKKGHASCLASAMQFFLSRSVAPHNACRSSAFSAQKYVVFPYATLLREETAHH